MPVASEKERAVPSSRPLHNFALPPHLQWGYQKQLHCVKMSNLRRSPTSSNCALNSAAPSVDHHRARSNPLIPVPRGSLAATARKNFKAKSPINSITPVTGVSAGDPTGIEAVREKLLSDLKVAADQLKLPILEDKGKNGKNNQKKPSEEELPWNLRNRRPAGKASNEGGNVGPLLWQRRERGLKSLWASDKGEANGSDDQRRPRFSLTLSKEEIETDFLLVTGDKPPKRPKRRPKAVQKQMDALFPGSWLTEITPEYYKVSEAREPKGEK